MHYNFADTFIDRAIDTEFRARPRLQTLEKKPSAFQLRVKLMSHYTTPNDYTSRDTNGLFRSHTGNVGVTSERKGSVQD